jgi:hypothetical protein
MIELTDVQRIFNRAFQLTFSARKLLIMAAVLALCGLLVVFFRSLTLHAGRWVMMSLTFVPLFLCTGVLLSAGIWLIRVYHDEVKGKAVKYKDVLANSWEVIIGASYFAIPILISYLLLWMMLGIFMLLKAMPGIGEFFVAVLAFAPFLLNLASLLLCILSVMLLFLITPVVALKGTSRLHLAKIITQRIKSDLFSNLLLGGIALLPLCIFGAVLGTAALLTDSMCLACEKPVYTVVHSFFVMIPFAALLAPAVIFFFNFAAEAHVLMKSKAQQH